MKYTYAIFFICLVLLFGCGKKVPPTIVREVQTIELKVPVPTRVPAPAELMTPVKPPLPVFVSPADPQASSALTADGERLMRAMIEELLGRIAAWQAWATATP